MSSPRFSNISEKLFHASDLPEARFQGEGVVPGEYFFGFYKTRHILLSDSADCTVLVLRAVVLTQYRRVTDGQTDRQTEML